MNLRSNILFMALSLMMTGSVLGQSPFNVDVTVTGLSYDTVYLANYYGSKLYYSDTAVTDTDGHFRFKGKAFDECGKYAVVLPGPVFFDIMLVNEPMEFKTTKTTGHERLPLHCRSDLRNISCRDMAWTRGRGGL